MTAPLFPTEPWILVEFIEDADGFGFNVIAEPIVSEETIAKALEIVAEVLRKRVSGELN
jgi:hypothetical protein